MISAVLFDLGGTLENLTTSLEQQKRAAALVQQILIPVGKEYNIPVDAFCSQILIRYREYKNWSNQSLCELAAEEVWGNWVLKDFISGYRIGTLLADTLTDIWELSYFHRCVRPDAAYTLKRLKEKGYRLGVISNTVSRTLPIRLLEYYGIKDCFETVILSSITGIRKPDSKIFQLAAAQMNVDASCCFYVGDQPAKDVAGALNAEYAGAALIRSCMTPERVCPDAICIAELKELLEVLKMVET